MVCSCTGRGNRSHEPQACRFGNSCRQLSVNLTPEGGRVLGIGDDAEQNPCDAVLEQLASDMVYVEGGSFVMGEDPLAEGAVDPVGNAAHEVTLHGFFICRFEVTQKLWETVMGTNPSRVKGDDLPVVQVSWEDCQTFIDRLDSLTGVRYRLPTEAEWEYACRGGSLSQDFKYSGSHDIDAVAWYDGNSGETLHPVGQKQANELGLYDMSGNVWEWCQDYYGNYPCDPQDNPSGPSEGVSRVCRGGSWIHNARNCLPSLRNETPVSFSIDCLGLRLVL